MAIIPQDSFILQGTIKFNIDPLEKHTQEEVIQALKNVGFFETLKDEEIIDQKSANLESEARKKSTGSSKDAANPELQRIKSEGATAEDKIGYKLETGGTNLSQGQR